MKKKKDMTKCEKHIWLIINVDSSDWSLSTNNDEDVMKNINEWLKQYVTSAEDPYAIQLTLRMNKNNVCVDMPELAPLY